MVDWRKRTREKKRQRKIKLEGDWKRRRKPFLLCLPSPWLEMGLIKDWENIKERKRKEGNGDTIEVGSGIILDREKWRFRRIFWEVRLWFSEVKSNSVLEKIRATIQGEISPYFGKDSGCCSGRNQSVFWKRFRLLFGVKSYHVLEEIQVVVRGEISPYFGRDLGCCSEVKSYRVLEEIRAAIRDEISLYFGRDLGCCLGWNQSVFWKRFKLLFGVKSIHILEKVQAAIQGEIKLYFGRDSGCCLGWNQSVFWKRFRLLFGMISVCVLEDIRAAVWGEISLCFRRDLGYCSWWNQLVFGKAQGTVVLGNQSIFLRSSSCKEGISRGSLTQNFYRLHSLGIRIPFWYSSRRHH